MTLALNLAGAPGGIREPRCEVVLSSHVVMLPSDPGEAVAFEAWFYVTNPSREMETIWPSSPGTLHSINVNWVNLTHIYPSIGSTFMQVYPNGTVITPSGVFNVPGLGERIRTVVYPMEKALVWYSNWGWDSGQEQGIHNFTFKVNIEYEEQTSELVETFQIIVQ